MNWRLGRLTACAAVAISLSLSAMAATNCVPTPDQASVGIRALQTELMVAGLKCSAEEWNTFARQFRATIKNNADRLQMLFRKTYGQSGETRMNSFVTQLANNASQRSNNSGEAEYCRREEELFKQVLALTGAELESFSAARIVPVPSPVAQCIAAPVVAASPLAAAAQTSSKASRRKTPSGN